MHRGYVKLWRKTIESPIWQNSKLFRFWTYCMMKATHKKITVIIGYQTIQLEPGQFVFGRKKAAQETSLSEREIRTCLKTLEISENVTIKTTSHYSILTIVNWYTYQSDDTENDQQNDQQTTSQRPTNDHIQEQQEYKNKNNTLGAKISKPKFDPITDVEIPENLNTQEFKLKWAEWCNDLKARRKVLNENRAEKQMAKLAAFSPDIGIEAIDTAIESKWSSVFPKEKRNGTYSPTTQSNAGKPSTPKFGNATNPGGRRFGQNSITVSAFGGPGLKDAD